MNLSAWPALRRGPLTGTWYRAIQPQHWLTALQTSQTKHIPSRYNPGPLARIPFEILYLAEDPQVALFEVQALLGNPLSAGAVVARPGQAWITLNVNIALQSVVDISDPTEQRLLDTTAQELTGDWNGYTVRSALTSVSAPAGRAPTQDLGEVLFGAPGIEAFRTLSAKVPWQWTLVVFPQKLQSGSRILFEDSATKQQHEILG